MSLEVSVQDPRGRPVAGALVAIGGGGGLIPIRRSGRTDEHGRVRIDALPRPPWEIGVLARGLAPKQLSRVMDPTPLVVRLETGRVISGVVRDSVSRDPVAGARVWVMARAIGIPTERWDPESDRIEATADASGRFRLEGLGAGPLDVSAAALGHGFGTQRAVRPGSTIELFLLHGATITGIVRDEAGKPVAGAVVRALGELTARFAPGAARTDAAGRFFFTGLDAGVYTLVARAGPHAPAFAAVSVDAQVEASVELTLADGGFVTGRLVDAAEKPLNGRVRLSALDGRELHPAIYDLIQAAAAPDGRFALGPMPVGSLALEAFAPGFAPRKVEAAVDARSRTADLGDVALETGLRVRGVVLGRDRAPIAGATVMRVPWSPSGPPPTAVTEEDGVFVLAGLQPGNLQISVSAPGYARLMRDVAAGNEELEVVLDAAGAIVGSVVDAKGQPVEGATLRAQSEPAEGEQRAYGGASADEGGGRFTIRDLRAGRYVLVARAHGHAEGTATASVVAGRTTDVGVVRLRSGAVVRGAVVDATGEPVTGATLLLDTDSGSRDAVAESDAAGRFEVAGVPPGRCTVAARHSDYALGSASVEIAGDGETKDVRIVLVRGGRVEGVVRHRDGEPFVDAQVLIRPRPTDAFSGSEGVRTATRADGSFAMEHVRTGAAQLQVLASVSSLQRRSMETILERQIAVSEGETTRVEIAMREVLVSGRVTRGGAPAPGIAIRMQRLDAGGGTSFGLSLLAPTAAAVGPAPLYATTNEDGHYELLVLEPGRYAPFRVSADGYRAPLRPASSEPGRALPLEIPDVPAFSLDLALGSTTVSGMVVDEETGRPVPVAQVGFSGRGTSNSVQTDQQGRFLFDVDPGEGRIWSVAAGYARSDRPLRVEEAGTPDLRIELRKGLILSGRVEDAAGRPRGGVPVQLSMALSRGGGYSSTGIQAMADGSFHFPDLTEGSCTLTAGSESAGFAVRSGIDTGTNDVVLTLRPAARVQVRVVDASGQPVAAASVHATMDGMPVPFSNPPLQTDATGTVDVAIPEGSVTLESYGATGHGRAAVQAVGGATIAIEIVLESPKPRSTPVPTPPTTARPPVT